MVRQESEDIAGERSETQMENDAARTEPTAVFTRALYIT
jgi:hypothetical protein